jgi:diguanylate cyclase (GGDEF)-like protein
MNLRPRFLLLTALSFVVFGVSSWAVVRTLAEGIVEQWAVRYAEKQVLYDKSRTLQPILREVALARQLAHSQHIKRWARQPDDPSLTQIAISEMESFRPNFQDRSYFVALTQNGHYYHNNASDEFAGRQLRYTLDPGAPKDAWFYDLVRQQRDLHINVNPDVDLGITKLWIDVLIRDGNDILGMAGTGLDLTSFIRNVVEENVPGVTSMFVDHNGAIQIHRQQQLIDFGSVSKNGKEQKTIGLLLDREKDRQAVLAAMKTLERQDSTVSTLFVEVQGKRHLVGIAYLPEIDWYEITLMDLAVLLPFSEFGGLLGMYVVTLVAILLLFNLVLRRYVLQPLTRLDEAMTEVEAGTQLPVGLADMGTGEMRRLMERFTRMTETVLEARRGLEAKVQARTAELEQLTITDPLTGLLNRRGMTARLEAELSRSHREDRPLGILWLDVDWFKQINDQHGHGVGDQALKAVAQVIGEVERPYDTAARWGGDEFLVMLSPADAVSLDALGERLRAAVAACTLVTNEAGDTVRLTVSIGGYLSHRGENLNSLLLHGDEALYAAKEAQRNCYRSASSQAGWSPKSST